MSRGRLPLDAEGLRSVDEGRDWVEDGQLEGLLHAPQGTVGLGAAEWRAGAEMVSRAVEGKRTAEVLPPLGRVQVQRDKDVGQWPQPLARLHVDPLWFVLDRLRNS